MATGDVVNGANARSRLWAIPVLFGMLAYPAIRVASTDTTQFGVALVYGGLAYLLAIYLFYGIARLAFSGQYLWLLIGGLGGFATGTVVGGASNLWFAIGSWVVLLATGVVVGRLLAAGRKTFDVFIAGVVVLTLLTLIAWLPSWQEVYETGPKVVDDMVQDFEQGLTSQEYSPGQVEQLRDTYKMLVSLSIRLTPASTIITAIIQLSLGFLWLTWRVSQANPALGQVRRFIFWKVPFALTPVTGIAILARLLGNEEIRVIADNALLVLAIFYSVCGLSYMEYLLHRFGASLFIRILFYVMLFLTQVAGLIIMVLVGFVDSFLDWRKVAIKGTVEQ